MQNNKLKERADQRVLIFPARIPAAFSEKDVYFLLSVTQVEDIIKEMFVHQVPFSPSYAEGIVQWREHVVPVLSLEKCLFGEAESFPRMNNKESTRLVMVRSADDQERRRGIFKVLTPIRMSSLPIQCTPISSVEWITNEDLVRAIYEWEEGYLVVPFIEKILGIKN